VLAFRGTSGCLFAALVAVHVMTKGDCLMVDSLHTRITQCQALYGVHYVIDCEKWSSVDRLCSFLLERNHDVSVLCGLSHDELRKILKTIFVEVGK